MMAVRICLPRSLCPPKTHQTPSKHRPSPPRIPDKLLIPQGFAPDYLLVERIHRAAAGIAADPDGQVARRSYCRGL